MFRAGGLNKDVVNGRTAIKVPFPLCKEYNWRNSPGGGLYIPTLQLQKFSTATLNFNSCIWVFGAAIIN